MHPQAQAFYAAELRDLAPFDVLEFGSCILNGSVRDVYPQARSWLGVDVVPGWGVDVIADAATWRTDRLFDVVVCAEVFEHTADWREIVDNAHRHLNPDGLFLASCATADRPPHSAVDGGTVRDGEHYENVSQAAMSFHLASTPWAFTEVRTADGHFGNDDLYIKAIK